MLTIMLNVLDDCDAIEYVRSGRVINGYSWLHAFFNDLK
jgi:hypothetical protein